MSFRRIDRRTFVLGGVALSTLAACGGGTSLGSEGSGDLKPDRLGVRFPDGERAPSVAVSGHGNQRFPFVVIADDGLPMITDTPESIEIDVLLDGELVTTETVAARGVGQFTPYYPLTFTPPEVGWYVARTSFSDLETRFLVVERADTPLFQVGEKLPGFDSPTFDAANGVDPVCTRSEPCPFHEITLTEALTNGKPTALLIATPAFCQTDVCGSNLEFLIDGAANRADINVIHAEVYANFAADIDTGALPSRAPMLEAWDIAFEPSLFAIDGAGTILDARHFAFDREETVEVLNLLS